MSSLEASRRRFIAHFSSIGLGGTLAPGILWARMQDAGADRLTLDMVTDALKLAGIEITESERDALVQSANQNLSRFEEVRKLDIPNDVSPPFHFSAIVPGIDVNRTKKPFRLSAPPVVKRPVNLEEVAFWPLRHLAELVRTRKVTSSELTQMYLSRVRMMMMMKLAEATQGLDVYLVASNNSGGTPGRGGAGRAATPEGAAPAAAAEGGRGGGRGRGRGGEGGPTTPQGPAQRHSTMANLACYPAINVPNGFSDNGQPTNVTFFARPFGETELLALAKAYQDAAGFHLMHPKRLDTIATTISGLL